MRSLKDYLFTSADEGVLLTKSYLEAVVLPRGVVKERLRLQCNM